MKAKITFTQPLLGTLAGNKEIAEKFILSKHKVEVQEDELSAVETVCEELTNGSTVLYADEVGHFLFDYQIKGFMKSAVLARFIESGEYTKDVLKKRNMSKWVYKRTIDTQVFVSPRKVYLSIPDEKELAWIERPLRCTTLQGDRIALARSEAAPEGTTCEFEITCLNKSLEKHIPMLFDYGKFFGIGQWRGGGFGTFTTEWE